MQMSSQGGLQAHGAATKEGVRWRMGLPPTGGCNGGGGFAGGGDLLILLPEHSSAIYCNSAYYGPVYGGEVEARDKGGNTMVVTQGFVFVGDADGSLVGGGDKIDRDCDRRQFKW